MRVTYFPRLSIQFSTIFDAEPILRHLHHNFVRLQAAAMVKHMQVEPATIYRCDKCMGGKLGIKMVLLKSAEVEWLDTCCGRWRLSNASAHGNSRGSDSFAFPRCISTTASIYKSRSTAIGQLDAFAIQSKSCGAQLTAIQAVFSSV